MSSEMQVDFQVMQMLCSRLCHDLVGTVGAVNAAVELIGDEAGTIDPDIIGLLSSSAGEASRKLAFYRAAYGLGGSPGALTDFRQARELVEGVLGNKKINIKWVGDITSPLPNTAAKLVYLLALMASEALPRGGILSIHVQLMKEGLGLACAAEGTGAVVRDTIVATLSGNTPASELSSREVHAYYAKILAESAGTKIEMGTGESLVNFAILVPFSSIT